MSLSRQFLREFRPLFRMLGEPLRAPSYFGGLPTRALLDDPFFGNGPGNALRPAVDVSEEGNAYIVEAELPGVKKENVEVRIGDGGRSVTIQGRLFQRGESSPAKDSSQETTADSTASTEVAAQPSHQISNERTFSGTSTFTRTVWLPHPVDAGNVVAKLQDGILNLTIPKAEDKGSLKVPIQ